MKKKLLLLTVLVMAFVCLLVVSASAADSINPSTSNAYGTLTTFDEAIGNTQITNLKDDGTIARAVITDGSGNYYTVPTVYLLTEHSKNRGDGVQGEMFNLSFTEITAKIGFTVSKDSIIRIEFPSDIKFICSGNENLSGCTNMVECVMNDGVYFWDNSDQRKVFTNCKKLKSIDVSGMVMDRSQTTFAMFEYCPELEYVKLPDAYYDESTGAYMDYNTSHMFSGCNKLKTIENLEGFFKGDKTLNYKTFYNCWVLEEITLPEGLEVIEGRAIGVCKAITSIIIPDKVTEIGTNETVFESCTALKKVVFPSGAVSVGAYAFEKCTALTDIWMPGAGSTFAAQVFGQCGSSRAVNFYFTTAESTITFSNAENKDDPFVTALNTENDTRIKYNTPLSTKCTVFLGGHTGGDKALCTDGIKCARCTIELLAKQEKHVITVTIEYPNGIAVVGKKVTSACENDYCTLASVEEDAPVIVTALGYSYREDGKSGLCGGFEIDQVALKAYKDANPTKAVTLSILIANPNNLDQDVLINAQGAYVLAENVTKGAVQVDITNSAFRTIEYKVAGFSLDNMKNLELCFAVVVKDDSKVYTVQSQANEEGSTSVKNTYTAGDITLCSVTVESIAPDFVAGLEQPVE